LIEAGAEDYVEKNSLAPVPGMNLLPKNTGKSDLPDQPQTRNCFQQHPAGQAITNNEKQ